jgi:hypothetical protein
VFDGYDAHVFVFPDPAPVRAILQLRIARAVRRHARTRELHSTRMQNVTPPIDQQRVRVQSRPRQFDAPRAPTALERLLIPAAPTPFANAPTRTSSSFTPSRPSSLAYRQRIIHNYPATLERHDLKLPFAVRQETDQVQLPQRRLRDRLQSNGREPPGPITQLLRRIDERASV